MKDALFGFITGTVGILGLVMIGYVFGSDQKEKPVNVRIEPTSKMVLNGDTTRTIYVLQDSTSGIVWIGIPGVGMSKR